MTKASSVQCIRLFNAMLDRANSGRPGLTLTTWERNLDFLDREQILDAMNRLQHSGHIRVDIGGERPAIVILKGNYKDTYPLAKPLVLGMAPLPVVKVDMGIRLAPDPLKTRKPGSASLALGLPAEEPPPTLTDLIPAQTDYETAAQDFVGAVREIAAEVMPPAPAMPVAVTFVLDTDDMEFLCERLDGHRKPLSLDQYAKELLREYLDLLRAEDGPKHRLSVAVLRAARDDERPLPDFVTALIEIGLTAYQMNREAV